MQEQKRKPIEPRRMEIWYAKLDRRDGSSVQGGSRPVLILSNDINNAVSSVVTVLPMTSRPKKLDLPSHTWIEADGIEGFDTGALVLAEQITTIDQSRLVFRMGGLKDKTLITLVENSVDAQLGMEKTMKTKQEYLAALPKWDGVQRIDTMLRDYLGAADSEYVRAVSRNMMLTAIAKVKGDKPFCGNTPLLIGPSFCGKSVFIQKLGSGYSGLLTLPPTPRVIKALESNLIVELCGDSKADRDAVKTVAPFLWVATTNQDICEGFTSRRICPVHVHRTDTGAAFVMEQDEVDLLWAEAIAAYEAGEEPYQGIGQYEGCEEECKPIPKKYPYGIE